MARHHSATFGDHRQCGSGDVMVLEVEENDSTSSQLNQPLMFISV